MYYSKVAPEMQVPDAGAGYAKTASLMGRWAGAGRRIRDCQFLGFGTCLQQAFSTTHKGTGNAQETFRQIAMQSKNYVPKWKNKEKKAGDFLLNPR